MYVDAHCHSFQPPETGDTKVRCVMTCRLAEWPAVSQLARDYPRSVVPAFGVHPWYAEEQFELDGIELLVAEYQRRHPAVVIGEIGLDYGKRFIHSRQRQLQVFGELIRVASKYSIPVSVHCVKAWQDLAPIIRSTSSNVMLHAFGGGLSVARQLQSEKIFFSLCYRLNHRSIELELLAAIGESRLLIESDADKSANELQDVFALIAAAMPQIDLAVLRENFQRFLGVKFADSPPPSPQSSH